MARPSGLETFLMNGRRSLLLSLAMAVGTCSVARAWSAVLPPDVRNTTNAAAVRPQIQAFLAPQIAKLSGTDATEQSAAKDAIVAEVQPGAAGKPSDLFYDAYCEALDAAFKPLLKNSDIRVRLNLAVIAARVAERAPSPRLLPTVTALLGDDNEAVALWAVKAAKPLVPAVLNVPANAKNNTLIPAVVAAAGKFVNSGPLIQSAYSALSIEQAAVAVNRAAWNGAVPLAVKGVLDIMAKRVEAYAKDGVPQMPNAEGVPLLFLTQTSVWPNQPADLQTQTVQTISNLISVAGQHVGRVPRSDREGVLATIVIAAKGLSVVGLEPAAKPLTTINAGTDDLELQKRVTDLYPNLVKKYPALKPAPKIAAPAAQ